MSKEIIEIEKENFVTALNMAPEEMKPVLLALVGKTPAPTKPQGSWKDVVGWESACARIGHNPALPDFSFWPERHRDYAQADYQSVFIVEAINTNDDGKLWVPNYTDGSTKFYVYQEVKADSERPGGFGFLGAYFDGWHASASAGSRLAFETSEKAEHFIKYFEDLRIRRYLIKSTK